MTSPSRRLGADTVGVVVDLAIEAAGIGTYEWDLATGRLTWDARMLELFGLTAETFDGTFATFERLVHPDDLPSVMHGLDRAVETCSDYDLEYRLLVPGAGMRWIAARGRALRGPDGTTSRVIGAAFDTTTRQDGEARVARVLESIPTAFFSLDRQWRFGYVNAEAERVLERTREELLGGDLWELFPGALGSDFEAHYRRAMESGQPVAFEAYYPLPLDRWYEVRVWPGPDGLSVYFLDITARRNAQQEAESAAERASLTARITSELAESLEAEDAVARLAQLVVPALADWCVVTLVDDMDHGTDRRRLRDVGSWHGDPALRELVARYAAARLGSLTDEAYLTRALETSQVVTIEDAAPAIARVLRPGEARDILDVLAPGSAAVLPMRARGRTVGALSLFNDPGRGPISPEELVNAEEVAGRAGLALDNSRLYRQQRRLAEGLQRSLLTDPPEPDHLQIEVRYVPAAEAAKVGGDWYDAFLQPDGATVLVIGDVVGHDVTAAAAMGQVRSILRGIGAATGDAPATLLARVDRALRTLQSETIATAVVARIEQTEDEWERGITHVRWSNAGHPEPMVINPDGTVALLAGVRPDILLGVRPDSRRVESEVTLDRGATVLLYTDGLVERRDRGLRDGMADLRDALGELAAQDLGLSELCDAVIARLVPPHPADDVALVAVRLHRQDRPRPAEAGPNSVPPDVPDEPGSPAAPGSDQPPSPGSKRPALPGTEHSS
jgi:PAS domain S-box-containing protein